MTYQIAGKTYEEFDPLLNQALESIYGTGNRPLCMCRHPGIEMYVAKLDHQFIIKRLPDSGGHHSADCDSYEPPAELSGLGEVMGGAIRTNVEDGLTTLKFEFSLSKNGGRVAPTPSGVEKDSVKTDGKKLSLRGTLHYLYDQAGLARWSPLMEGKRSWWVLRKFLLQAASDKVAKGGAVSDLLYIPESFAVDKKDELTQRRMVIFNQLAQTDGPKKRLMLLIGEVKEMGDARFGKKMVIKHVTDANFNLSDDIFKRFAKRFSSELALWNDNEDSHLIVIATFGVNAAGVASIEEASVMLVNENWIPYDSVSDKMLLDALTTQKRRFTKCLRYNMQSTSPLASAVLSDTPAPVAMYISSSGNEQYTKHLSELVEGSSLESWQWDTSNGMPPFPAPGPKSH